MPHIYSFDGTKIYFVHHKGSKETLIFVHGWPLNHTVWDKEVKYFLKQGYGILALDLRGHGKSGKPTKISSYKMECFAKDVKKIIQIKKIEKPVLIGHSFGGMVVLKFAELYPGVSKALVLSDTNYENPLKDLPILKHFKLTKFTKHILNHILSHEHIQKKHFKEVEFSKMKDHSDLFYWFCGVENTPFDCIMVALKDMLDFNEKKLLGRIKIPCLIIEGERDHKTPKNVAYYMDKKLKNSKLVIIKKTSHDTNLRGVRKVNSAIKDFLENL